IYPKRMELTVSPPTPPPATMSEDDLDELFRRIGESGVLTPEQLSVYERYRQEMARAESDPAFHAVPSHFMPSVEDSVRFREWRRTNFPELAASRFGMLRVASSVLKSSTEKTDESPLA